MKYQNDRAVSSRRAFGIAAYAGANGSGKSLAACLDSMPTLLAGRHVLSTVRLLDWQNPRPCEGYRYEFGIQFPCDICLTQPDYPHRQAHPGWVRFTSWDQLMEAKGLDVIMDEVTGVASSRESHGLPSAVANKLVQLRRADVVLRWTSPNWARADKIIRECTQAVTHCSGFLPVSAKGKDGEDRMWRHRRLFRWRTYDAADFTDFTEGKRDALTPWVSAFHWGPGSQVFDAYDTLDSVSTIGTVTDSGRCYRCGGTRRAPKCSCVDHADTTEVLPDPILLPQ